MGLKASQANDIHNMTCWTSDAQSSSIRLISVLPTQVTLHGPKARAQPILRNVPRTAPASNQSGSDVSNMVSVSAISSSLPSLINSTPMSPWSMVSRTAPSSTADAISAAMDLAQSPVNRESSSLMHEMMAAARARACLGAGALLSIKSPQAPLPLTPEQLSFDEPVDAAIAKPSALIAEAKAQLEAPIVAPNELTQEELQERHRNRSWDNLYRKKNEAIDMVMERGQALLREVETTIDDIAVNGIELPKCDDSITWEPNAGFACTSSRAASMWSGMSVRNLIAKFNG